MGQTQTATYMTGPKLGSSTTSQFLPAIGSMQSSYKAFDTYPAPSPLRRSHTTLPWRPSTYYGVAKVNPTVSYFDNFIDTHFILNLTIKYLNLFDLSHLTTAVSSHCGCSQLCQ